MVPLFMSQWRREIHGSLDVLLQLTCPSQIDIG